MHATVMEFIECERRVQMADSPPRAFQRSPLRESYRSRPEHPCTAVNPFSSNDGASEVMGFMNLGGKGGVVVVRRKWTA